MKQTLIVIILVTYLMGALFAREHKHEKHENHHNEHESCPRFDNCYSYQVTQKLTDYGCGIPHRGYLLEANANGIGYVNGENHIENCLAVQTKPEHADGKPYCFLCKKEYALTNDNLKCVEVEKKHRIRNCQSYFTELDGSLNCDVCDDKYILLENKRCKRGESKIKNCRKALNLHGTQQCNFCEEGFIGISNEDQYYSACVRCHEWIKGLTVAKAVKPEQKA